MVPSNLVSSRSTLDRLRLRCNTSSPPAPTTACAATPEGLDPRLPLVRQVPDQSRHEGKWSSCARCRSAPCPFGDVGAEGVLSVASHDGRIFGTSARDLLICARICRRPFRADCICHPVPPDLAFCARSADGFAEPLCSHALFSLLPTSFSSRRLRRRSSTHPIEVSAHADAYIFLLLGRSPPPTVCIPLLHGRAPCQLFAIRRGGRPTHSTAP
jgi:hypothetical protein